MPESKGWTLVKVAGLLGEAFERFKGILGLISAAGGVGGFVAYYYSLYAAYQVYVLIGLAVFAVFVSILVTAAITAEIFRRRDKEATAEFVRLKNAYVPFESEAIRLIYQVALASEETIDLTTLEGLHADYLAAICNTAVGVFEAKKPSKKPFTASMKRMEESGNSGQPDYRYRPWVRSSKYDEKRKEYDENLEDRPLTVQSNYAYRRIFDPQFRDDFFIQNDISELLNDIAKSGEITEEPNSRSGEFYQSLLVFPLLGLAEADNSNQVSLSTQGSLGTQGGVGTQVSLANYMQYKGKNVFGVIAADSLKKKAFNLDADADIMKELTSYAVAACRIAQTILDLSRKKNFKVILSKKR